MHILIDSAEFIESFACDAGRAQESLFCQMLSLEAGRAGSTFLKLLSSRPSLDRRVIADRYSNVILNDKALCSPTNFFNRNLRARQKATAILRNELRQQGVSLKLVNPLGLLYHRLPSREHRKYYLVDSDIAYIGGINISDHNFAWHDMMIRISDPKIVAILRDDFEESWLDRRAGGIYRSGDTEILIFNGLNNFFLSNRIIEMIDNARKSIYLQTPYISFPYFDPLKKAAKRGVKVRLVTPQNNNWALYDGYIRTERLGCDIEHFHYPRMTHMKALLVDERCLITGSANFEYFSARLHREVVLVSHRPSLVEQFLKRVVATDAKICAPVPPYVPSLRDEIAHRAFTWIHKGLAHLNRPL